MTLTREAAKAAMMEHYKGYLAKPRVKIEVPEWLIDGKALVFYVGPQNLQTKGAIRTAALKSEIEGITACMIARAENEEGKKLFIPPDRSWMLTAVHPDTFSKVASKILDADATFDGTPEEAEGN